MITTMEMLEQIVAMENASADVKEKATAMIEAIKKRNADRKVNNKKKSENAPIEKAILEYLADKTAPVLSVQIATDLNLTASKVNGVAGNLEKENKVVKVKVKVKGKGEQTAYALPTADDDDDDDEGADE